MSIRKKCSQAKLSNETWFSHQSFISSHSTHHYILITMCSHGLNRKKVKKNSGWTKPEYEQRPNKTKVNMTWSHWELKGKTRTLPGTRKNAGEQVVIFAADWLRGWWEFIKGPMETKVNVIPSTNQIQHRDNVGDLTANLFPRFRQRACFYFDLWLAPCSFVTLFWLAVWSRLH